MANVDPREHDLFHISQRFRPMVNQYEVSTLGDDGKSAGQPVCFVEQKRFKLKEELVGFTDDGKTHEMFRIKARQVWDPRATYDISGEEGKLGGVKKVFGRSLRRSTWEILSISDSKIAWAQERDMAVAIGRRVISALPYLVALPVMLLVPYHFDFYVGEQRIGELRRIWGVRDRYALDLSADSERTIDRRVALALAVGMDAMQAR